jgi:hypothetical protein
LEPQQLEVEVVPPARIFLPKHDHQQRREEENPATSCRKECAVLAAAPATRPVAAANRGQHDHNRDRDDDPERRRQPVQVPIRIIDRELHWILVATCRVGT